MFLPVYKFFCFNGEPKLIQQIQNDKQENETVDYFDIQWNQQDIKQRFPNSDNPIPKPKNLEIMLELAKKLSINVPFLRVDFYVVNDKILFSEYTFYTDAGYSVFEPEIWDIILGKWITLEQKHEISVKSIGGGRRSLNKKSYQIICNYEKMEMIAA